MSNIQEIFQQIPSVDKILSQFKNHSIRKDILTKIIRSEIEDCRIELSKSDKKINSDIEINIIENVKQRVQKLQSGNFKNVINGTGIVLHTGLGRAPFNNIFISEIQDKLIGYQNLEFDLNTGKRGERLNHVRTYLKLLSSAESSIVVNNNAAALILILNTLSDGKEVIISRGELIEIGGSFRLPDVIGKSGAILKEIGTTNRTHISDYQNAISEKTGGILLVHTSNYKIQGFTKSPSHKEIIALAKKYNIPIILDQGSGNFGYNDSENDISKIMKNGYDIVCFSGDKLLGGPQSGIILGKKNLVDAIHKNAFYRAFRCDKFTILALEWTLNKLIFDESHKIGENELFSKTTDELKDNANKIIKSLDNEIVQKLGIEIIETKVETGSGSLPTELFDSIGIIFHNVSAEKISKSCRNLAIPIIGYINNNKFIIDLKTIREEEILLLSKSLINVTNNI